MCTYFPTTEHVAKKPYQDAAYWWLHECIDEWWPLMTYAEKKLFAAAHLRQGWIEPGMKYTKCNQIRDGVFGTYRGSVELTNVCRRLNVWENVEC